MSDRLLCFPSRLCFQELTKELCVKILKGEEDPSNNCGCIVLVIALCLVAIAAAVVVFLMCCR